MKKNIVMGLVVAISLALFPFPVTKASATQQQIVKHFNLQTAHGEGEIILQLLTKANGSFYVQTRESSLQNLCSSYQLVIVDRNLPNDNGNDSIQSHDIVSHENKPLLLKTTGDLRTILDELNDPSTKTLYGISYAEPHYLYDPCITYNDPLNEQQQPSRNSMHVSTGLDITDRTDVTVVYLDTGGDIYHEDLREHIASGAWDFVNETADVSEQDVVHGSYILGSGAVSDNGIGISGMVRSVPILPLKISTPEGKISTFAAVKAIDYAIARLPYGKAVFNASWGGTEYSQALDDAISRAGNAGMLFITAAGNAGSSNDLTPFYPANSNSPYKISVGAYDNNVLELANFSNFGLSVDIAAPGVDILTTSPDNRYTTINGTSIASPEVAVAAALIMGRGYTALEAKQKLLDSATELPELTGRVASGLLNLRNAMALTRPAEDANAGGPFVIKKGETIQFLGLGKHADYQWDFGNNRLSTEKDPLQKFKKIGRFTVTLTVSDGSEVSTSTTIVTVVDDVSILKAKVKNAGNKFIVSATSSIIDESNTLGSLTLVVIDAITNKVVLVRRTADSFENNILTFKDQDIGRYFPEDAKAKIISDYGGTAEMLFRRKGISS